MTAMTTTMTLTRIPGSVRERQPAPAYRGPAWRPRVSIEPTCSCGQALECCHAAHCPRCGVSLHL